MHNRANGTINTPPPDAAGRSNGAIRQPTSAASSTSMGYSKLTTEYDNAVYPIGNNLGIDPTYPEHVHNIPYALPAKELDPSDPRRQYADGRKKSTYIDPGWIRPPQILLVEDDPTCRQIGGKFLYSFHCAIDTAVSFDQFPSQV
jgi:osomolarity two-component system response regulator SKN7